MSQDPRADESLLIDLHLGQLPDDQANTLRQRIQSEPKLATQDVAVRNALGALKLSPEPEPPEDLASRTMARIRSAKQTSRLLAAEEARRARGFRPMFSLRELGAIAATIIVFAAVLIPSLRLARQRAQQGVCAANMGEIGSALQTFAINHDGRMPGANTSANRWMTVDGQRAASNSSALFRLLRDRLLTSPVVFQCPSVGGASFVVTDEMVDFPKAEHISYSYQHSLGRTGPNLKDPRLAPVAGSMAILADQTPVFPGGRFRPDRLHARVSENHDQRGQNVMYLDSHVRWTDRAAVGVDEDNIFLIRGVDNYRGTEVPANPTDTFLLPAFVSR